MFRGRYILLSIVIIFAAIFCAGCQKTEVKGNRDKKVIVYASFYPLYDFAKSIGGDKVDVKLVVPPGADAHEFEPTAKLMGAMEEADVFIYNGLGIEPWAEKLTGVIKSEKLIKVEASKGVELIKAEHNEEEEKDSEHNHGEYDPHVWLNPLNAIVEAENIKNALVKSDEKNKNYYEENFNEFKNKLTELDKSYTEGLKNVKRREIVTAHSAFTYLARRYGLKQLAITGLSPQGEPSLAKMAELAKFSKKNGVKYIFFEAATNPKLSEVLANEVGAKTAVLNPLESLREDEIKEGKNYISVMKENLETLKKALED